MTRPLPVDDPDAYFHSRGFALRLWGEGDVWWADLTSPDGSATGWPRYGSGASIEGAKQEAVRRWKYEQEPTDLRRRPGEPLP